MVLYVDLFALANLVVDLLLLVAVARLTGLPPAPGRLLLGACLGAAYATAWYAGVLPAPLGDRWAVWAAGALMVVVALAPRTVPEAARALAAFYAVAAGVFGLAWLAAERGPGFLPVLLLTALAAALADRLWRGGLRARAAAGQLVALTLELGGRRLRVPALVDSGHRLRDPLVGEWVVIADEDVFRELQVAATQGRPRLRLVPYASVDRRAVLVGLRCDGAGVEGPAGGGWLPGVVVARAPAGRLDPAGRYRALVPLGMVVEAREAGSPAPTRRVGRVGRR